MAVMRSAAALWAAQFALAGRVMKGLQNTVGAGTGETVTIDSQVSLPTPPSESTQQTLSVSGVLALWCPICGVQADQSGVLGGKSHLPALFAATRENMYVRPAVRVYEVRAG